MVPSYQLDHALINHFCFPYYSYGVLFLVTTFIQLTIVNYHEKYGLVKSYLNSKDDKRKNNYIVQDVMDKNKKLIVKYFNDYTFLSCNIINIIVNDYYYDDNELTSWLTNFKPKLEARKNQICKYFNVYVLMVVIMHLTCFVIIIWINIEWIIENDINGWYGFQSITFTIFFFHPASKIVIIALVFGDKEDNEPPEIYPIFWKAMILSTGLTGFVNVIATSIFIIPAIIFYIPVLLIIGLFVLIWAFVIEILDDDEVGSKTCSWIYVIAVLMIVLLYCSVYFYLVYSMVSISCVYSKQLKGHGQWYMCLYQSLFSPQCPNTSFINIDWNDWRAVLLFVSWMLF